MASDFRTLQLPATLCERVEQQYGARFGGLDQFVAFVLQELLRDDAAQMDREEQRIVEQRLKDLGYI